MPEAPFEYKELLYNLCDFLINKKKGEAGKGIARPLEIRLQEFARLFPSDDITRQDMIKLKKELEGLTEELDLDDRPLLRMRSLGDDDTFIRNFEANSSISLIYRRIEMEDFFERIKAGDISTRERETYDQLLFEKEENKWMFKYKGRRMPIRQQETTGSIRLNLCLLLFGQEATYVDDETNGHPDIFTEYPDYEIGNKVDVSVLEELIFLKRDSEIGMESNPANFKKIQDAVDGINSKSQDSRKGLGIKIFHYEDQEVSVVLP